MSDVGPGINGTTNDDAFDTRTFFVGPSNIDGLDDSNSSTHQASCHDLRQQSQLDQFWSSSKVGGPSIKEDLKDGKSSSLLSDVTKDYLALGVIRLYARHAFDNDRVLVMQGQGKQEIYPNQSLTVGEKRQWFKTLKCKTANGDQFLRVYALPEDINRSIRGSLKDFRKVLKSLIDFIDISPESWNGDFRHGLRTYNEPKDTEEESLFYIFNTLASPHPSMDRLSNTPYSQQAMADVLSGDIDGLKTQLYPYQKRSVAAMLQKEANPAKVVDPRKPMFTDLRGRPFYLDILDGVLLLHPPLYSEPQGGILAETMGYGKTLICIALILATRGHYPEIPEGRLDIGSRESNHRTPSLLELAAKTLKRSGVPWKAQLASLERAGYHFDECKQAIDRYEAKFAEPIFYPTTPDRKASTRESFSTLRLCYATLVIVPPNLLVQWQHEIEKHTLENALDVLMLDSSTKTIPSYDILMNYDIVLITKARFDQEYRDDDLNQGRRRAGEDKFRSPLTEVRWLRVICDEGHGFAGATYRTNAMAMIDKMSIERRWVVSGTPSNSLHGVEVNLATNETTADATEAFRKDSIQNALEQRKTKDSTNEEIKDMERLRTMVVKFLKLQPWANQKGADFADWRKYLAPFDASGNRRFAPALKTILQSLIIRHRIEDIDVDLSLPPLYNKTVYLEPSYYDKLSMNLFRMVLTSNAVTSERADEDYMFHPRNRKPLDELITNLRHSSFHWVGFTEAEVSETVRVSNTYLDKHIDTVSDVDGALLTEAIMIGQRALDDPGWRAFSFLHEIGVYVDTFPEHATQAWALHGEESKPLLLGTVQAREAQQHVLRNIQSEDPAAGLTGAGLRAMQAAKERAAEEQKARDKSLTNGVAKSSATAGSGEPPKIKNQSTSSSSVSLSSPVRSHNNSATAIPPSNTLKRPRSSQNTPLPLALRNTQILGFSSAKLNYLCTRILSHHKTEKTIVFYDSNNIAFWIAEALELLSIKFLIYANTLSVSKRAAYLATFNHSDVFRVLLMDLKQASHGLHVASASRVFIVSPIWQPGVEAQAIKRAHRIGQTRPVYVETLVLSGTLEEKILRRRRQMSEAELVRAEKSLLDDRTMNEIIREEGFLRMAETEKEELRGGRLDVPVPLFERRGDAGENGNGNGAADDNELILGMEDEHVTKKRKKTVGAKGKGRAVAFAATAETVTFTPEAATRVGNGSAMTHRIGSPSIFGPQKPKKSVRIMIDGPSTSDEA